MSRRRRLVVITAPDEYDGSGYVVFYKCGGAKVSTQKVDCISVLSYAHCSCYGSETAIAWSLGLPRGRGVVSDDPMPSTPPWLFDGTVDAYLEMAARLADPALPARTASPDDHGYAAVEALYGWVQRWAPRGRRPLKRAARVVVRPTRD